VGDATLNNVLSVRQSPKHMNDMPNANAKTAVASPAATPTTAQPPAVRATDPLDGDTLLTKAEAAAFLRCVPRTIENLMKKRQLPHYRLNRRNVRFYKRDLLAFLDENYLINPPKPQQ
jgi:excisionase family DNA binding protein